MINKAVIIVSSQDKTASLFLATGKMLKARVYPHSRIVKTICTPSRPFELADATAKLVEVGTETEFSFAGESNLDRVLTISHSGPLDGPNLAYHVEDGGNYQPWGGNHDGSLPSEAKRFWGSVGDAMKPGGKIILLGCRMGQGLYAANVARAAQQYTYAARDEIAAGHAGTVLKHVSAIEGGKVLSPMVEFQPV